MSETMETVKGYWRYWGKARKAGEEGAPYQLLPYHCLDVAAVGKAYLAHHAALRGGWAVRLGISEETLTGWMAFFLALHDLGKFSYRFQGIRRLICQLLKNDQPHSDYTIRHDTLGQLLWSRSIGPLAIENGWFGACAANEAGDWSDVFEVAAKTVTGHHGQPPNTGRCSFLKDHFSTEDEHAARDFAADCANLLLLETRSELPDIEQFLAALEPLSWWLAGFSVLCDWLGSNEDFFRYRTEPMPLRKYWNDHALPQAERALLETNLLPRTPRPQTLVGLFRPLEPPARPTPLQQMAADLPFEGAPHLFILEDVTGAGKTEAALMLAYRLIAMGQAEGFYFGLPTMATSNAMFRRVRDNALPDKFFLEQPNLVLAHSASRLEPVFPMLSGRNPGGDAEYGRDEASASGERSAWFADSRKKALLADLGVGTVDQALLAVLYSRHQSLRLLGLARKVLIVDEVHACDDYMLKLLEVLLTFHAAVGGSTILLSATLPHRTRQTLADAYGKGLGRKKGAVPLREIAYPLLTWISPGRHAEIPLATRPEVARTVRIDPVHTPDAALAVLLAARAENHCACWIRNTVDDAIAACELLRLAGVPADDLMLFHARFALVDRMKIEDKVLGCFGPNSQGEGRRGKILVATQVVEQSLDLDFDVLLSDLTPVDLVIQRAGRLCRHRRDALGNRTDEEGRGTPRFWLYGPEFTETPAADWLAEPFAGTAAVYPDHGRLWLTARFLGESGALVMPGEPGQPGGARTLIEGVYGPESEAAIPAAFQAKTGKVEGDKSAKRSLASANTIKFGMPYEHSGFDPWDDTRIPTRLEDQPSVTVRLASLENGNLRPWHDATECHVWELSQLSVRYSLFADELHDPALETAVENCRAAMPDRGKWSKLLVLTKEGGAWVGKAKNGKGETVSLCYDAERGLRKA